MQIKYQTGCFSTSESFWQFGREKPDRNVYTCAKTVSISIWSQTNIADHEYLLTKYRSTMNLTVESSSTPLPTTNFPIRIYVSTLVETQTDGTNTVYQPLQKWHTKPVM